MIRTAYLFPLLLVGCVSEAEQTLRSWEGVYRFTRATEASEDCSTAGPDVELEHGFFELDSAEGIDAHLAELRPCSRPDACESVGFLTWLVPKATDTRLDGARDDLFFTVIGDGGGLCQALHEAIEVRRSGPEAKDVAIAVYSSIATDVVAASDEECLDLLATLAADPNGCDSFRVFEGRRVH